jgi:very-short-patch-repair endonuclease
MNKTENAIKMNEARWGKLKRLEDLDWEKIQSYYDSGKTWRDVTRDFQISNSLLNRAVKSKIFFTRTTSETAKLFPKARPRHTTESKLKLSNERKKFLLNNPDKHPWRNVNKFSSRPCEHLKSMLKARDIQFVEEYQPLLEKNRFYSIDIAIREKKIGIEVNGNRHYNRDGTLKNYYKERHDLITECGWTLHEVHYSMVFNKTFVDTLADSIRIVNIPPKSHL